MHYVRKKEKKIPIGQLLRAYFRSKRDKREVYELDPPFWDLGRESWGARSEPLPLTNGNPEGAPHHGCQGRLEMLSL